jgi:hypothetical protein
MDSSVSLHRAKFLKKFRKPVPNPCKKLQRSTKNSASNEISHFTLDFSRTNSILIKKLSDTPETLPTPVLLSSSSEKLNTVNGSSIELVNTMKKSIFELQKEAKNYLLAGSKILRKGSINKSKESVFTPETFETDLKGSFSSKANDPFSIISNLKSNIELLADKLNSSEIKVDENAKDNQKLKQVIKDLEDKIERYKIYGQNTKNYSCASNCQII